LTQGVDFDTVRVCAKMAQEVACAYNKPVSAPFAKESQEENKGAGAAGKPPEEGSLHEGLDRYTEEA